MRRILLTLGLLSTLGIGLPRAGAAGDVGDSGPAIVAPGFGRLAMLWARSSPGLSAFGRVVDAAQRPVAGAEVVLVPAGETRNFYFSAAEAGEPAAATGADGRFTMAGLQPGRFDLYAQAPGFALAVVPGVEVGQGRGPTDLGTVVLRSGAVLEGRVVDLQDQPIEGAQVAVTALPRMRLAATETRTAADGTFSIPNLRPKDSVALEVEKQGFVRASFRSVEVPGREPLRIVLTPAVRISGRLVDEVKRQPVPEAEVAVYRAGTRFVASGRVRGARVGRARAGADGRFVIEGVEPGKLILEAVAPGFIDAQMPAFDAPGGRNVEIELALRRGAVVAGRVLGPDGRPVPGARVSLSSGDRTTSSDKDGNYRLEGVADGLRTFIAEHDEYQRAVQDLKVELGDNRLDLRLAPGFEVSGRVVDAAGRPVAGAGVEFANPLLGVFRSPRRTTSGADGGFRAGGLAAGVYAVTAEKPGLAAARLEGVRIAGPVEGLELRLEEGGAIRGRLLGLELADLPDVRVQAHGKGVSRTGQVDHRGEYRIEGLAAGEWNVVATKGSRDAHEKVTVAAGAEAVLDLDLGKGLTLSGRIVQDGKPVANATVFTERTDRASHARGMTGPHGDFRLEGLEPGAYRLSVVQRDTGLRHQEAVELTGDRELSIHISTQRIAGHVVDASDSSPVAAAIVSVEPVGGPPPPSPASPIGSTSDGDGAFVIAGVSPGAYRVTAERWGYAPAAATVEVTSGSDVDDVRLALSLSPGLTFLATGPLRGTPPPEVFTALLDGTGRVVFSGLFTTREHGRVQIATVPPGRLRLLVWSSGSATAAVDVTVPGPPFELRIPLGAELEVAVPALREGAQATVTVTGADGQPFRSLFMGDVRQQWPVSAGRARIASLPPGRWQVQATAEDGRSWKGFVSTVAGGKAALTLE
jgi:protocatechuate 3,4-dioxygenase beta subunit